MKDFTTEWVEKLEALVNCSPMVYQKVCEVATVHMHKTLQQNVTRFCVQWIKHMGTDWTISADGRNEDSVNLCRDLMKSEEFKEILHAHSLPYI